MWDPATTTHVITAFGYLVAGMTVREIPKIVLEKVLLRKRSEVLAEIPKTHNGNGSVNGNGLSYASRRDVREEIEDTLDTRVVPLLNGHLKILEALANGHLDMVKATTEMVTILRSRKR